MKFHVRRFLAAALVCVLLLASAKPARADSIDNAVRNAVIAIVVVTAALTVGIVYLVRHDYGLRGCATSTASGLQLHQENDPQTWNLLGDTAAIKPGDRVKVNGKKKKKDSSGDRTFIVSKVNKDYGPCPVTP